LTSKLLATDNLPSFQTFCANVSLVGVTILNNGDLLNIGTNRTVGNTVRVADVAPGGGVLTAD